MNHKPSVFIFDDEQDWVDLSAKSIQDKYEATTTTNSSAWNKHISSSKWDAIIVDVQLIGSDINGVEHAEQSILEYGVTSPVIITSGNVNLEEYRKEYGKMFFDYISKDDIYEPLLESLEKACQHEARLRHVKNVLVLFCKKFKILNNKVPLQFLESHEDALQSFKSNDGETIGDLIDSILYGVKNKMDRMAKIIFDIIRHEKQQ